MDKYRVVLVDTHASQYIVRAVNKEAAIKIAKSLKLNHIEPRSTSIYADTPLATKVD